MTLLGLLLLTVVVAFLVWLLGKVSFVAPFHEIVVALGVLIIVVAALQVLFGIDLLNEMRHLGSK